MNSLQKPVVYSEPIKTPEGARTICIYFSKKANGEGDDIDLRSLESISHETHKSISRVYNEENDQYGFICTAPIKKGVVVLKDYPLLCFAGKANSPLGKFDYARYITECSVSEYYKEVISDLYPRKETERSKGFKEGILKDPKYNEEQAFNMSMLLDKIVRNSFQITNATDGIIWTCLYNVASFVNHSCAPNIEYEIAEDYQLIMRTTRDLKPGDEICHNYDGDNAKKSNKMRKFELKKIYGFDCTCRVCKKL